MLLYCLFMKTIVIKNWKWQITKAEILEDWFDEFEKHIISTNIKSSSERDVFTIKSSGKEYFVKYSHPKGFFQKIRSYFHPKLVEEYKTIQLLRKLNISTPEAVGVGCKGSCSMLITEAVNDAVDLRYFWFTKCSNIQTRKKLLDIYTIFLKNIINSGLYHPDFHPGNILIKNDNGKFLFYLIDTYGIKQYKKLSQSKIFQMLCILGSKRGELKNKEASKIISNILQINETQGEEYWSKILKSETIKTNKLWEKRKEKLLKKSKYTDYYESENEIIRIRKTMTGLPCIKKEEISDKKFENNSSLYKKSFDTFDMAKQEWLNSFKLKFHRIPAPYPIAWIQNTRNNSNDLIYKNNENLNIFLSDDEILKRKEICGIKL